MEKLNLTPLEQKFLERARSEVRAQGGELKIRTKHVKERPMSEAPLFGQTNVKQQNLLLLENLYKGFHGDEDDRKMFRNLFQVYQTRFCGICVYRTFDSDRVLWQKLLILSGRP